MIIVDGRLDRITREIRVINNYCPIVNCETIDRDEGLRIRPFVDFYPFPWNFIELPVIRESFMIFVENFGYVKSEREIPFWNLTIPKGVARKIMREKYQLHWCNHCIVLI